MLLPNAPGCTAFELLIVILFIDSYLSGFRLLFDLWAWARSFMGLKVARLFFWAVFSECKACLE